MDSGILVGALAVGTIGSVLFGAIWHLLSFLRHPDNRAHAHNVFVRNGKAAVTLTAERAALGSREAKPLVVRLRESIDSQHEVDPSFGQTQAQRTGKFHQERTAA